MIIHGRHTRVLGRRKPEIDYPNPNSPRSPDYAERHQRFSYKATNGLTVETSGTPMTAPARSWESVPEPREPEVEQEAPAVPEAAPAAPAATPLSRSKLETNWRKQYGLGRGA